MKYLLFFIALTGLVSCQSYSQTKVGQDKYILTSRDRGAAENARLLKGAYDTCKQLGYNDYTITTYIDNNDTIMAVQCCNASQPTPSPQLQPTSQPTVKQPDTSQPETSYSDIANKMYQEFKNSFK
jgi:hypothetical protein